MDSLFLRRERKHSRLTELLRKMLRNRWLTAGVIVGGVSLSIALFGSHGLVQRIRLERERTELQKQLRAEEARERLLKAQRDALAAGDPRAVEKVARERHGMTRRGETVYKVRRED